MLAFGIPRSLRILVAVSQKKSFGIIHTTAVDVDIICCVAVVKVVVIFYP
jgi:hypothetical protein